ncbi:MAG: AtpZ/AtpI family protein [Bacteroidetes bacterium]|nr:AtpZ/AtpI family protein [Bacteroidota bacterium]
MAFQMLSIIVCLTLAGKYLDSWMGNKFPGFTVGFVIFSVFASVYLSIRDFLKD